MGRIHHSGLASLLCVCLWARGANAKEVFRGAAARSGVFAPDAEGSEPIKSPPEWGSNIGPNAEQQEPGVAGTKPEPARLAEEGSGEEVETEGKEEEEKKEKEEGASVPIALLMLMGIIAGTTLLAMVNTAVPHISTRTVLILDNTIAIFLAVLWFQGMNDMLDALIPKHLHLDLVMIHTVLVLFLAFAIAWFLKSRNSAIAIFCGAGAHYTAFSGRHFALHMQSGHFKSAPIICTLGFFVLIVCLGLMGFGLYMLKRACGVRPGVESEDENKNRFVDRFDDIENDCAAMSLASYVVIVVLFWVTQEFPRDRD